MSTPLMLEQEPHGLPGWAIVDSHTGIALRYGGCVSVEIDDMGTAEGWDLYLGIPGEPGLYLWQGEMRGVSYWTDCGQEHDVEYHGSSRRLTDPEVAAVFRGEFDEPHTVQTPHNATAQPLSNTDGDA